MTDEILRYDRLMVDQRRGPLFFIRWTNADLLAVKQFIEWSESRFAAAERYAIVMMWDGSADVTSAMRNRIAGWMRDRADPIAEFCLGQSYIVDNMLKRVILRSLLVLGRIRVPYTVVATQEEAERDLIAHLSRAGLAVPDTMSDWGQPAE